MVSQRARDTLYDSKEAMEAEEQNIIFDLWDREKGGWKQNSFTSLLWKKFTSIAISLATL